MDYSSDSSSPPSSSYNLLLNTLATQGTSEDVANAGSDSSVDEEALNLVYQRCHIVMNDLTHPSGSLEERDCDSSDSNSQLDGIKLHAVFAKCQDVMKRCTDTNSSMSDNETPDADSGDIYVEGVSHRIPQPQPQPQPQPSSSSDSDDAGVPSMHHVIMCSMARPSVWAIAYQNLHTLKYQTWLDASILNLYLLFLWYSVAGQTHVRYVDLFSAIPCISSGLLSMPTLQEVTVFQQRHLINTLPADPAIPVSFVALSSEHFFVVVFDYGEDTALILGRRISGNISDAPTPHYEPRLDNWTIWNGPFYWRHIAALHNYDAVPPDKVHIKVYNWTQNGYDCGPISCHIIESLMKTGLYDASGKVNIPSIPCGHQLRLQMLAITKEACRKSWEDYRYLSSSNHPHEDIWMQWDDTAVLSEDAITNIQQEVLGKQHSEIIQELNVVAANCHVCQIRTADTGISASPEDPLSDSDIPFDDTIRENAKETTIDVSDEKAQDLKKLLRRYPYVNKARARDLLPPHTVYGRIDPVVEEEAPSQSIQKRKNVKDWTVGSMFRFPRPTPAIELCAYEGRRWKLFDGSYDQYEGAPVLESLQQNRNLYEIVEEPYYRTGLWTSFRDYGYRLQSSFNQMFYLDPPVKLMDHVLPVGVSNDYQASKQINNYITGKYSLHRGGPKPSDQIKVDDVVILSAARMIGIGNQSSDDCINTFLCGRLKDHRNICLDLELDHIPLSEDDLDVVADIDSIIWVTRSPYFNTPLSIYLGPIMEEKAPMHKNNHVYVDILIPQSQRDADSIGRCTEWLTTSFPLCGIPNTTFGTLGNASGSMFLYICFPRMIHRDEISHKRANRIPKEVLDFFWEHILLPAISEHVDAGSAPYVSLTLDEVRFKARKGIGKKPGRPKAVPFSMDLFHEILSTMEATIRSNPDRYSNYGSFFFVLECKGIKLWAKASLFNDASLPVDVLREGIPCLEWEYMVNRMNGELFVDLGISIHPTCEKKMVGLWRLEALEASFGAGGFLRGNVHHTCTLGRYGGIQAEMSQERARQTHIAFRSAYNLSYEAVRPNDNLPTFVMDKDAYALSTSFMDECAQAISIYSGEAKKRSYGVRDEYRMSGMAIDVVMEGLCDKVIHFLNSNPILWLPSEVWFEFLARRVRALQLAQIRIKHISPPNLGLLTGIICHLIRCTSSTPIILDYHVRESMALLQFSRVCERFSMFFLYDLELEKLPILFTIQQQDSAEVLKLMQAKLKKKENQPAWPRMPNEAEEEEEYPIGHMPVWDRLIKAIREEPWRILRSWRWPTNLAIIEPIIGKLFVQFTCQLWIQIDNTWLMDPEFRPEPTSLEDAMQAWSLNSTFKTLRACIFKACNADIPGSIGAGRRQPSFAERVEIFFPDPEQNTNPAKRSPWNAFWSRPGYIWQYHQLAKHHSASEVLDVKDGLRKIFSMIQTLPDSAKGTAETPGRTWKLQDDRVALITNPRFYKIQGISKESNGKQPRKKIMRVLKPRNQLHMDLYEHAGYDEGIANKALILARRRRKEKMQRKSAKAKNARKPPMRQQDHDVQGQQCGLDIQKVSIPQETENTEIHWDMEGEGDDEYGSNDSQSSDEWD